MDTKGDVLMHKYEIGRLLGQGTFAKVHYGRSLRTGKSVAIKIINKDKVMRVGVINQIKREISVMRLVKHPYVVELHEVMATKSKIYFVLEYGKGGELFNKLTKGRLKEEVAQKYFQQLINAVEFCHSRGVYHRDLKPENILLDDNENVKVSDFGLSAFIQSKRQDVILNTTCGTPAYVAPEVIKMKGYDGAKADIWSCGVILFVLLAGYLPFHDSNLMELYRKIANAEFKFPTWFAPEIRRLLLRILDPNPNTRISLEKIKEHPWFKRELTNPRPTKIGSHYIATTSGSKLDPIKPTNINAFKLIGISSGFDLSGLFAEHSLKKETIFTSRQPASVIFFKLEEIAKKLRLELRKIDGGVLEMQALEEGRNGILSIEAEIFEVTPSFHLVEMNNYSGDTLEYHKVVNEGFRPQLQDIVWAWQGEQEQQPNQLVHSP